MIVGDSRRVGRCTLFIALVFMGCSSSRGDTVPGDVRPSPRTAAMAMLVGRSNSDAPPIKSLPPLATFAWVTPSGAFRGVTPEDDTASLPAVAQMREDAAAVLRANGWRETDEVTAEYLLSMVRVERTGERVVVVPDPRNERTSPTPRCDLSTSSSKKPCYEPAPPNYPPRREVHLYTDTKFGYAIRRRGDGATRWWVMEQMQEPEARRFVARVTLELLLAVEKEAR